MPTRPSRPTTHPADFAFASLLSGALASAVVALLFLLLDSIRGEPFFTPSLVGSAVFLGVAPEAVSGASTDVMAGYTVVHFLAFTGLGTAATWVWARVPAGRRSWLALSGLVLVALTLGVAGIDRFVAPGLTGALGVPSLAAANTSAALVMGFFIHRTLKTAQAGEAVASASRPRPAPAFPER